jgi:hypothetical protein
MTALSQSFQIALSRFQDQLTEKEREYFRYTEFKDVQKEIIDIQKKQESLKKVMDLTRIQGFLEAMNQFGQVIEVFLNTSCFVAFVWGPVKFILQVWL